jgi:hypothetical protein
MARVTRKLAVTFRIDDGRGKLNDYRVAPLEPDPEVRRAAWRLVKVGMRDGADLDVYTVSYDDHGGWSCECIGWCRYGYCKHCEGVQAFLCGLLPPVRQSGCASSRAS